MRKRDLSAFREVVLIHYGSADRAALRRVGKALNRGAWAEEHGTDTDLSLAAQLKAVGDDLQCARSYLLMLARDEDPEELGENGVRLVNLAADQAQELGFLLEELDRALTPAETLTRRNFDRPRRRIVMSVERSRGFDWQRAAEAVGLGSPGLEQWLGAVADAAAKAAFTPTPSS